MPAARPPRSCTRAPPSPRHIPPTRPGRGGSGGREAPALSPGPSHLSGARPLTWDAGCRWPLWGPAGAQPAPRPANLRPAGLLVQPPGGSSRPATRGPSGPPPLPSAPAPTTTRSCPGAPWASAVGMPPPAPALHGACRAPGVHRGLGRAAILALTLRRGHGGGSPQLRGHRGPRGTGPEGKGAELACPGPSPAAAGGGAFPGCPEPGSQLPPAPGGLRQGSIPLDPASLLCPGWLDREWQTPPAPTSRLQTGPFWGVGVVPGWGPHMEGAGGLGFGFGFTQRRVGPAAPPFLLRLSCASFQGTKSPGARTGGWGPWQHLGRL